MRVTKSFRLDGELVRLLSKVSRQKNLSETAYLSSLLESSLKIEPLTQNTSSITMDEDSFREIVSQVNKNGVEILAGELARRNVPSEFEALGLAHNLDSIRWYMKEVLCRWGWFKMQSGSNSELIMFHNYGLTWSIFLKSYVSNMIEILIGNHTRITIDEKFVEIDPIERAYIDRTDPTHLPEIDLLH